jgi:hypothetical protein
LKTNHLATLLCIPPPGCKSRKGRTTKKVITRSQSREKRVLICFHQILGRYNTKKYMRIRLISFNSRNVGRDLCSNSLTWQVFITPFDTKRTKDSSYDPTQVAEPALQVPIYENSRHNKYPWVCTCVFSKTKAIILYTYIHTLSNTIAYNSTSVLAGLGPVPM